ncbi:MAG: tyrosine recombinase [bacterium]
MTGREPVDAFLYYIEYNRDYSSRTIKAYSSDLKQFRQFMTDKGIDVLSTEPFHIRAFMAYLNDRSVSKRTVSRKIATLKSFFKYLLKNEIIETNPLSLIKTPGYEKKLPEFLSVEVMRELLSAFNTDKFTGKRDKMIFEILYATGMRSNEMLSLKADDIDLKGFIIRIRYGKGGKERLVPFNRFAADAITAYLAARPSVNPSTDYLIVSVRGRHLTNRDLRRIVKKHLKRFAVVRKMSPHTMRHTFATHMLDRGADIRAVQELLGHSSIASTQIYTHTTVEKLKEVYSNSHPLEKGNKD